MLVRGALHTFNLALFCHIRVIDICPSQASMHKSLAFSQDLLFFSPTMPILAYQSEPSYIRVPSGWID